MILFANAKINLGLHITGKRSDGYHNIETVLYPVPHYDVIEFYPADQYSLHLYGETVPGSAEENIVTKAFRLLKTQHSIPEIEMHLLKNIPAGSGLGGGSSDAANLLSGLNRYFHLRINHDEVSQMAESLGSDCPFFLENRPMLASGKGEILQEIDIDLKGYFLVLAFPEIHIPTEKAYSFVKGPFERHSDLNEIIDMPVEKWNGLLTNDFENAIFSKYPELEAIKSNLTENGALYASLTGSGSVIYGIYKNRPSLKKLRPDVKYLNYNL